MMFFGCFLSRELSSSLSFTSTELSHVCLQSKFSGEDLRSCHFYCHFSAEAIVFPVSGYFLLSGTSFALLCNVLRGAVIPVNGCFVISPHVCDDLGSVQREHAGGTPSWGQRYVVWRKHRKTGSSGKMQVFITQCKQKEERTPSLLHPKYLLHLLSEST